MNKELAKNVNRCLGALRQLWRAEEGFNMVVLALIITGLVGFVGLAVDGSNVFFQHQRLQIAADAAALGGARLLAKGINDDALDMKIRSIALKNSADSVEWTFINDGRGISVVALRDVDAFFAKLYGYDSFAIMAEADAQFEPVSKTYDLFPLTLGCDCVEDGMLTLVADDPVEPDEAIEDTGPMTVTVGLDDNKDTSYLISYLGRAGNTWTYFVSELEGRDLASWGLGIESCLDEVQASSPVGAVGTDGFDGIKWIMPFTATAKSRDWRIHGSRMGWMASAANRRALRHTAEVIFCQERNPTMEVTTVGLDLGKDVFQVHGITSDGTVVFNRTIRRRQLLKFFETLPSCLVGIEACGSAHHWARELTAIGHDVRLMPAAYVKPYVKRGKTDAVDAEAICEAVTRPTMRFVAVKSKEQQALLTIHRVRQLIVRQKTQMLNVIRGLLREFGHVIGNGPVAAMRFIKAFETDDSLDMPDVAKNMLKTLCEQVDCSR